MQIPLLLLPSSLLLCYCTTTILLLSIIPNPISANPVVQSPHHSSKMANNVYTQHENQTVDDIHSVIDRILDLAINRMKSKTPNPVIVEDEVKQYKKKILFVDVDATIKLHNGKLWGLNNIKRYGDVPFYVKDGAIYTAPKFFFDELTIAYDFEADILKLCPSGKMSGDITNLIVETEIQINILEYSLKIVRTKLAQARKLTIHVESEKIFDSVANYVLKLFTSIFKTSILNQLDKEIKNYLGTGISIKI